MTEHSSGEVPARAKRRTFTGAYKLMVLAEYEAAAPGHRGEVLLPLTPAPSCAFALLREDSHGPADGRAVADLITRLSRGIRGAMTSQAVASAPIRPDVDLSQLSSRELEIVTRLMAGDRVPAIAKQLFLSEGTIRNHLSSVFGKLGVKTQQELIELLRQRPRSL